MTDNNDRMSALKETVALLLAKIPEYRDRMDAQSADLPYVTYGFFALYLLESVSVNDADMIRRVFELLNELCDSENAELQNLAQVAVFEVIAGDRRWDALAESHLGREGLNLFRDVRGDGSRSSTREN
jgi:hypothetical protein